MAAEIDSISQDIIQELYAQYDQLRVTVAGWVAYAIIYQPTYTINYNADPLWDGSGQLVEGRKFKLTDYPLLGDFLAEYTGNSMASDTNEAGFIHQTYKDYFQAVIQAWIDEGLSKILILPSYYQRIASLAKLSPIPPILANEKNLSDFITILDKHSTDQSLSKWRRSAPLEFLEILATESTSTLFDLGFLASRLRRNSEQKALEQNQLEEKQAQKRADELLKQLFAYLRSMGIILINPKLFSLPDSEGLGPQSALWIHIKPWLFQLPLPDRNLVVKYGPFADSIKEGELS